MKLPILVYDCDNCGLCCTEAFVCINRIDLMREPKLRDCRRIKEEDGKITDRWLLNAGDDGPCRFHTGTGCGIYGTRPNVCAGFEAGNLDCQSLRKAHGLAPLVPRTEEREETYVTFKVPDLLSEPESGTLAPTPQDAANSAAPG